MGVKFAMVVAGGVCFLKLCMVKVLGPLTYAIYSKDFASKTGLSVECTYSYHSTEYRTSYQPPGGVFSRNYGECGSMANKFPSVFLCRSAQGMESFNKWLKRMYRKSNKHTDAKSFKNPKTDDWFYFIFRRNFFHQFIQPIVMPGENHVGKKSKYAYAPKPRSKRKRDELSNYGLCDENLVGHIRKVARTSGGTLKDKRLKTMMQGDRGMKPDWGGAPIPNSLYNIVDHPEKIAQLMQEGHTIQFGSILPPKNGKGEADGVDSESDMIDETGFSESESESDSDFEKDY